MAKKIKNYNHNLNVWFDDYQHAYILKVAKERGCSMAEVIRRFTERDMLEKWQSTQKLPLQ